VSVQGTCFAAEMTSIDFAALMREERQKREIATASPLPPLLAPRLPIELEMHRVGAEIGLSDCFYLPNFLSNEEAQSLKAAALQADGEVGSRWASLPGRRLLNLGGVPHASGMFAEPLPHFAQVLSQALCESGVFEADAEPDQFLINEYFEEQGIDAHRDGPLYQPKAAIISIGTPVVLDFFRASDATIRGSSPEGSRASGSGNNPTLVSEGRTLQRFASVALEDRSLLMFCGEAYTDLWHGISSGSKHMELHELCINSDRVRLEPSWQRGYRISFTVRKAAHVVPKPATAEGDAEARRRHSHWMRAVADKRNQAISSKVALERGEARVGQKLLFRSKLGRS